MNRDDDFFNSINEIQLKILCYHYNMYGSPDEIIDYIVNNYSENQINHVLNKLEKAEKTYNKLDSLTDYQLKLLTYTYYDYNSKEELFYFLSYEYSQNEIDKILFYLQKEKEKNEEIDELKQKGLKRCPICNRAIHKKAKICAYCKNKSSKKENKKNGAWKNCPKCGKELNKITERCPFCNFKLLETKNKNKFSKKENKKNGAWKNCPQCGVRIPKTASKCYNCIHSFNESTENNKQKSTSKQKNHIYKLQIKELDSQFQLKEKYTRNLIEKGFPAPQMTNYKFNSQVDECSKIFHDKIDILMIILESTNDYTINLENEIQSNINILKEILNKLDSLYEELLINISKSGNNDIENLFEEINRLIDSVKYY